MRREERVKFYCISGTTPEEFQTKMQDVLSKVSEPEIHFPAKPLMAYVYYRDIAYVPETLREQMRDRGEVYTCVQCPYFERTNDLRKKWHYCVFHQQKCHMESECCDEVLFQIASGTIEMKGGKRR